MNPTRKDTKMSDDQKTALEIAREKAEAEAKTENEKRQTVEGEGDNKKVTQHLGTRVKVGATRGKNPSVITFEQWDDSIPESLPKSLQQFLEYTKANEATMLDYAIRGHNDALYEAA